MKALWLRLTARFDALSQRERLIVFFALAAGLTIAVYAFYIEPAATRARALEANIAKQRQEIATIAAALREVKAKPGIVDESLRAREREIRKQITEADESIRAMQRNLVPAHRVNALLQEMVKSEPGLRIVGLKTLAVAPLLGKPDDAAKQPNAPSRGAAAQKGEAAGGPAVYKHGVEITVRGTYPALHAYLERLERAPARMFWWRAQLATSEQERALTLTLTLFTLSLDKAWLQV